MFENFHAGDSKVVAVVVVVIVVVVRTMKLHR